MKKTYMWNEGTGGVEEVSDGVVELGDGYEDLVWHMSGGEEICDMIDWLYGED